ncbi:MAG: component of SufBCD complex [Paracoccaceae bacterium]
MKKMRAAAAIRTNKWTDEERRLLAVLQPVFGRDIYVVFHDRPDDLTLPVPVVDISSAWVESRSLTVVPDWGWRCGDYFYYALRSAVPEYDQYWLIEPDVYFTGPAQSFFAAFKDAPEDVLGYKFGPYGRDIRFARGLPGVAHYRSIFAMTRLSGRAVDRLFLQRQKLSQQTVRTPTYPNDEIFVCSMAAKDEKLSCGQLETYAPDWFAGVQFATDPDLLIDEVAADCPEGRVLHPVRSKDAFKKAVAKRLSGNASIAIKLRKSLDCLSLTDLTEIGDMASAEIHSTLNRLYLKSVRHGRRTTGRK